MPRPGSGVIHPDLLASIETVVGTARPDVAQVQRKTIVNGPSGTSATPVDHGPPVGVRIVPATALTTALERVVADRLAASKQVVIAFPSGHDVQANDLVIVNGTRTFDVLEVIGPVSYEVERYVMATERNQ